MDLLKGLEFWRVSTKFSAPPSGDTTRRTPNILKGVILGDRGARCKVWGLSAVRCATRAQQVRRWATVRPQ